MKRIAVISIFMPTALFAQSVDIPFRDRLILSKVVWELNYMRPILTLTIKNPTEETVIDFGIECDFLGKSGTRLSKNSTTIYDTIPPLSEKTFKNIEIGYVNPQSSNISCMAFRQSKPSE
jgi:hypothetical protein